MNILKKHNKNIWFKTSLIVLASALLCSCDALLQSKTDPNGIVYCSEGSPANFNPQLETSGTTVDASSHQIYDRLIDFDPVTGDIVPALATSWLVSDDGKTYTFQLRQKVPFHNTETFSPTRFFNAEDVLFLHGLCLSRSDVLRLGLALAQRRQVLDLPSLADCRAAVARGALAGPPRRASH